MLEKLYNTFILMWRTLEKIILNSKKSESLLHALIKTWSFYETPLLIHLKGQEELMLDVKWRPKSSFISLVCGCWRIFEMVFASTHVYVESTSLHTDWLIQNAIPEDQKLKFSNK